jgi:hypothetical protein
MLYHYIKLILYVCGKWLISCKANLLSPFYILAGRTRDKIRVTYMGTHISETT